MGSPFFVRYPCIRTSQDQVLLPGLPIHTPLGYMGLAVLVSIATGLFAGVAPARRAASLDPVEALRSE